MPRQDTTEFLAAFAVGTVLGIGATLLLRPEGRTAKERLLREITPQKRGGRRPGAGPVRRAPAREPRPARGRHRHGHRVEIAEDAIEAGRELLSEFRDEIRRIVDEARDEVKEALAGHHGEDGEAGDEPELEMEAGFDDTPRLRRERGRHGGGRRFGARAEEE